MQVLIETRLNALKLNESKKPRKGCLGRLEGVCADFKNPTRNGRLYPRGLWEKVFNDELFKEAIESKTLIGELDHPEERFESLASEACIVMTDYSFDDDAGLVYGGFDILDTPKGRILKSLLDYGCVMGVSSRGQGDIIESSDGEVVSEDTYDFSCFDVVTTPAVAKARQNVKESVKREKSKTFVESIKSQIADAETVADLNIIRSVVRTSGISDNDMDSLIESIEYRCNSLHSDEETILSSNKELKNSDNSIITESKTGESTNNSSAKTIRDNKKLYSCISEQRKQLSAYRHREKRFVEAIQVRDSKITELSETVSKLKTTKSKTYESLSSYRKQIAGLNSEIDSLTSKLTISERDSKRFKESAERLRSELSDCKQTISSLKESLQGSKHSESELRRINESLKSNHSRSMSNIDSEVRNYEQLLDEATQRLSDSESKIKALTEKQNSDKRTIAQLNSRLTKANDSLKSYQESYLTAKSKMFGVDAKSVQHLITSSTTSSQIDSLLKESQRTMDRYNKLPISDTHAIGTKIISEQLIPATTSEEADLQRFVEGVVSNL